MGVVPSQPFANAEEEERRQVRRKRLVWVGLATVAALAYWRYKHNAQKEEEEEEEEAYARRKTSRRESASRNESNGTSNRPVPALRTPATRGAAASRTVALRSAAAPLPLPPSRDNVVRRSERGGRVVRPPLQSGGSAGQVLAMSAALTARSSYPADDTLRAEATLLSPDGDTALEVSGNQLRLLRRMFSPAGVPEAAAAGRGSDRPVLRARDYEGYITISMSDADDGVAYRLMLWLSNDGVLEVRLAMAEAERGDDEWRAAPPSGWGLKKLGRVHDGTADSLAATLSWYVTDAGQAMFHVRITSAKAGASTDALLETRAAFFDAYPVPEGHPEFAGAQLRRHARDRRYYLVQDGRKRLIGSFGVKRDAAITTSGPHEAYNVEWMSDEAADTLWDGRMITTFIIDAPYEEGEDAPPLPRFVRSELLWMENEALEAGDVRRAADGRYVLAVRPEGDLVLRSTQTSRVQWSFGIVAPGPVAWHLLDNGSVVQSRREGVEGLSLREGKVDRTVFSGEPSDIGVRPDGFYVGDVGDDGVFRVAFALPLRIDARRAFVLEYTWASSGYARQDAKLLDALHAKLLASVLS